ncbi:hypothetical protein ASZ90_009908 [hydrocarbon metagenome]|uniref:Uncharacterized protein n=1 Tax=hydrocarbon metagenome TaxID=938273 RepID=A0A0W8FHK6_9ZZZZ
MFACGLQGVIPFRNSLRCMVKTAPGKPESVNDPGEVFSKAKRMPT